jgi:hypothetical protein
MNMQTKALTALVGLSLFKVCEAKIQTRWKDSRLIYICTVQYVLLHLLVCLFVSSSAYLYVKCKLKYSLKVVTSEKIGGSGVMSTLGTWYGGVVMGVLLPFNEAAILYRHFNCAPLQKQKIIVFAANNSRCCE